MSNSVPSTSFCSELAKQENEPLAGSAMTAEKYVFISWSKKLWARKQYDSQGFPQSLTVYLQNLQKDQRIFTRLIHQHGKDRKGYSQIFVMPDGIEYRDVAVQDIELLLREYFDGKPSENYQLGKTNGTILFCCTHGKRDRCCAKFGQLTIYELRRLAEARKFKLDVWECTHINADRFAVNAFVFPHGYMYGGIRVENAREIIDLLVEGYPFPPCFRGQLGLNTLEQVTQAFGHTYWYEQGIRNADVLVESVDQVSVEKCRSYVVIKDKQSEEFHARFALTLEKTDFVTYMDCDGVDANRKKLVSRWVISDSTLVS